jgi:LysM repeat protein
MLYICLWFQNKYMNTRIFGTILLIFLVLPGIRAQKNKIGENNGMHRIFVDFKNGTDIFFPFEFVKGSSVYRLSKAFQVEENKIFRYNEMNPGTIIQEGSIIQVPVIRKNIVFSPPKSKKSVVLLYKIKPSETIYHIAKRKMQMETEVLKKMNGLQNDAIREGGELILGWYVLDKPEEIPFTKTPDVTKMQENKKPVKSQESQPVTEVTTVKEAEEDPETIILTKKRVIGFWDKNNEAKTGLFVLSDIAKPGTKIELYYPMNRTQVTATVIGRIPQATYPDEIEIFISPEVARRLGIFDKRFSLETRFVSVSQ